ncbi:hypothetical protein C2G38_2178754 [Gigaspora rosea]|uniref:TLDc domain-containing protein n=1 Tax=Gigaspora rosea TaxID=44941 RepID=A0A397VFS4_9GLOM|nr:hypothetical protein C2G38_2178754 [Gigaspora rosea]
MKPPNRLIFSVILPHRIVLKQALPPRTAEPFSTIISEVHTVKIASWIDKRSDAYSVTINLYEFELLLHGTINGFTSASFWNLCNSQTNVVVDVKVEDTDEIFGGYNPNGWDKPINDENT